MALVTMVVKVVLALHRLYLEPPLFMPAVVGVLLILVQAELVDLVVVALHQILVVAQLPQELQIQVVVEVVLQLEHLALAAPVL
jgi:hypothetical protein